jgi:hypothetical protein
VYLGINPGEEQLARAKDHLKYKKSYLKGKNKKPSLLHVTDL